MIKLKKLIIKEGKLNERTGKTGIVSIGSAGMSKK